jgi:flagellar motor switch protein FliG
MGNQVAELTRVDKLTGTQRVAILMLALGTENASRLMGMMTERQVEQISFAIAELKDIPPLLVRSVVSEFKALMMAKKFLLEGGVDMAREMLQNSLGNEKARDLIRRLEEATGSSAFAMFQKADIAQIVQILQNEHPQVAAVILGHLKIERAAEILSHLQDGLRADISFRLATMKKMSPDVLQEIEKYLRERVEGITSEASLITGGPEFVAKLLNATPGSTEKGILENLSERDPTLVEEIKKYMFLFEDILRIDDRTLQRIIKDLDNKDLVLALKGSVQELMEKFTKNMSTRAKDMLLEEMEMLGPVRVRDVEEAQQRVIQVIKQLEDSGEITLLINDDEGIIE